MSDRSADVHQVTATNGEGWQSCAQRHPQIERSSHRPSSGSQWASPGSSETGRPVAGDRWHSLPMPCDRLVGGPSKRNHRVRFAGHGAVRHAASSQNDIWDERFIQTLINEWAYARPYGSNGDRLHALRRYVQFYNRGRPHTAIGGLVPHAAVNNVLGHHS
ncbi:MAG: integrase core domain-containing protein [Acidimicrobiia bacterium]